ncbi:hypothetical protein [Halarchaeum sp. P4]|uniref:hypothetical protein n=1 Tax=Halarchaeum sp. P4 TaxID=3421639 RepID=UPI003EB7E7D3
MTDADSPAPSLWKGALASGVLLVVVAIVGEPKGVALLGALLPVACVAWVRYDSRRAARLDEERTDVSDARSGEAARADGDGRGLDYGGESLKDDREKARVRSEAPSVFAPFVQGERAAVDALANGATRDDAIAAGQEAVAEARGGGS